MYHRIFTCLDADDKTMPYRTSEEWIEILEETLEIETRQATNIFHMLILFSVLRHGPNDFGVQLRGASGWAVHYHTKEELKNFLNLLIATSDSELVF